MSSSNTGWNITSTGTYNSGTNAPGWFSVEIELVEFTGTGGPSNANFDNNNSNGTNWTADFGLGFFNGITSSLDRNTYSEISATSTAIDADPASGARIRAVLVPEPTSAALAGLALLGLGRRCRRA